MNKCPVCEKGILKGEIRQTIYIDEEGEEQIMRMIVLKCEECRFIEV
jgi:hypothetical protein